VLRAPANAIHAAQRRVLIAAARRMNAHGINHGRSGNISLRVAGGFLITPTGMDYATLKPADIVAMDMAGRAKPGRAPSSEWPMHCVILRGRPDANAIVHTHSPSATALACLRRDIPRFHYMVAAAGGESIRCAAYALYGSEELARHALAALGGRKACLLANHGVVALGADVDAALGLALEVEKLAEQYLLALQAGEPVLLTEKEMAEAVAKFADYGKQPARKRRGTGADTLKGPDPHRSR
jgi:L-fuculose-phosphate aldolase